MTEQKKQEKVTARAIMGKEVVSKGGKNFGEVGDLIFDTKTGEVIDFTLVNARKAVKEVDLEKDSVGDYLVPYHSVIALGDFLVISEEDILG